MQVTALAAMQLAIAEAKKGAGFVSPNPLVGCVILDSNRQFLASGYHARIGEAHAEVHALSQIQDMEKLKGAHLYVTLEPCAHVGRTPSCAKTLAQLPIESVTYGLKDPNPLVSGKGAEILRAAGIRTDLFVGLETELEELCEIFLLNMRKRRPFVALKVASTLDGKVAMTDGTSQWITGTSARTHVQTLRGIYDAVLVGAGTCLRDNPRLNSRDPRFLTSPQRLVILDPKGQTVEKLQESALYSVRQPENIFLVTGPSVVVDAPVRHFSMPAPGGHFAIEAVLGRLYDEGMRSIFIEGGPYTYGSFLSQQLIDRVYLFLAPRILGEGLSWPQNFESKSLDVALGLENLRTELFGDDLLVTGRVKEPQP